MLLSLQTNKTKCFFSVRFMADYFQSYDRYDLSKLIKQNVFQTLFVDIDKGINKKSILYFIPTDKLR